MERKLAKTFLKPEKKTASKVIRNDKTKKKKKSSLLVVFELQGDAWVVIYYANIGCYRLSGTDLSEQTKNGAS